MIHVGAVDKTMPGRKRADSHMHILGNGEIGKKAELLMNGRDSESAGIVSRQSRIGLVTKSNRAGIWGNQPAEDVLQRRFSGSVLSHEGNDLAL